MLGGYSSSIAADLNYRKPHTANSLRMFHKKARESDFFSHVEHFHTRNNFREQNNFVSLVPCPKAKAIPDWKRSHTKNVYNLYNTIFPTNPSQSPQKSPEIHPHPTPETNAFNQPHLHQRYCGKASTVKLPMGKESAKKLKRSPTFKGSVKRASWHSWSFDYWWLWWGGVIDGPFPPSAFWLFFFDPSGKKINKQKQGTKKGGLNGTKP